MDSAKAVMYMTAGVIILIVVASGPIIGGPDFTSDQTATPTPDSAFAPGTGAATITVVSVPKTAVLDRGDYGAGTYQLRVPDATVRVNRIRGQPLIVYKLKIPALSYTRSTTHFFSRKTTDEQILSIESANIEPDRIDQDQYEGELRIIRRIDNDDTYLYRGNVTIRVRK